MLKFFLATVFCLIVFSAARADPIVINSGTLSGSAYGIDNPYAMNIAGVGFSLLATGETFGGARNIDALPGSSLLATTFIAPGLPFTCFVTYAGVDYGHVKMFGRINFSPFLVNIPTDTTSTFVDNMPFTMTGELQFMTLDNTPLFNIALTGSGLARVNILYNQSLGRFAIKTFDYAIQQTPEPSTLILFGSGLFGSALGWRNKRRH